MGQIILRLSVPRGPAEVVERMQEMNYPLPSQFEMDEERIAYLRAQALITASLMLAGEDKLAVPPPCVRCPSHVLHVCSEQNIECKRFERYVGSGKWREV